MKNILANSTNDIYWFSKPHLHYSTRNIFKVNIERRATVRRFRNLMLPFGENYYSKFFPIFSTDLKILHLQQLPPIVHLQDGMIPLLWFLLNNKPSDFPNTTFSIESSMLNVVPRNWQGHLFYYKIKNNAYSSLTAPKILISSLFFKDFAKKEDVENFLNAISIFINKKNITPINIELFCPIRDWETSCHEAFYHLLKLTEKTFGQIGKFWKNSEIVNNENFNEYLHAELNTKLFYADNYLSHLVCHRGGYILSIENPKVTEKLKLIESCDLSFNHKIEIFKRNQAKPNETVQIEKKYKTLRRILSAYPKEKELFPWPKLFEDFCLKTIKLYPSPLKNHI